MVTRFMFLAGVALAGCSEAVQVAGGDAGGGVVTYVYKEARGPMFSPYRGEALRLIAAKCPHGYVITKEGETRTQQGVGGIVEGTEDLKSHRWGLQFTCKDARQ